eukprot:CAMPEP_0174699884 /NCGR_PEP_ID=MMETSP1094-20130205/5015_1 /TAXON_ID=156173 /ORGANISM="Chrysochromulina brevifilum, Strain UTEX LB 985" /LENGTH=467 /DNA_ID=CAMNT_0015897291 /DNA_START=234 /DNA_END=1638 /DNA_ORIENTATION=+
MKSLLMAEYAQAVKPAMVKQATSHVHNALDVARRKNSLDGRRTTTSRKFSLEPSAPPASAPEPVTVRADTITAESPAPNAISTLAGSASGDSGAATAKLLLPVLDEAALFTLPRGMQIEDLISWDIDILTFDNVELMQIAAVVFKQSGVLRTFDVPSSTLAHFLATVGSGYHANPYHNFNHGVHVLLCSWLLARTEQKVSPSVEQREANNAADEELLSPRSRHVAFAAEAPSERRDKELLSPLHMLALLVAAVCHDVDHPGVNNAFLGASHSPLAIRYNDTSILESHHAAMTFTILADKRSDLLGALSTEQRKEARRLMIAAILATDMAHHQEMVKELTQAQASDLTVPITFTLRVLLHVADLGNCAIRWELSKVWSRRVCDEATAQAVREQQLGLPCGKMSYSEDELMERQLVFVDGWVRPLFKAAAILYPAIKERLTAINECRDACRSHTLAASKGGDKRALGQD